MKFLLCFCAAICIVGVYSKFPSVFPIGIPKDAIDDCIKTLKLGEDVIKEVRASKSFSGTSDTQHLGECLLESSGIVKDGKTHEVYLNTVVEKECIQKETGEANIMSCLIQKNFLSLPE